MKISKTTVLILPSFILMGCTTLHTISPIPYMESYEEKTCLGEQLADLKRQQVREEEEYAHKKKLYQQEQLYNQKLKLDPERRALQEARELQHQQLQLDLYRMKQQHKNEMAKLANERKKQQKEKSNDLKPHAYPPLNANPLPALGSHPSIKKDKKDEDKKLEEIKAQQQLIIDNHNAAKDKEVAEKAGEVKKSLHEELLRKVQRAD